MVNAKKYTIGEKLIFIYLVLFPFGQLLRIPLNLNEFSLVLHPVDIIAFISFIYFLIANFKKPLVFISYSGLMYTFLFTWVFSLFALDLNNYVNGLLYLIRLTSYGGLLFLVITISENNPKIKSTLAESLIIVLLIVGIFGWIQYLFFNDLRNFTVWGWDDHLYRMTGTFLDPGFYGLLINFGFLASLVMYFEKKKKTYLYFILFFLITLGFSYSRASIISLLFGFSFVLIYYRKLKYLPVFLLIVIIGVLLLPRPSSSGVQLERLYSVISRINNYIESIVIFNKYPLFGVGYNNLCSYRKEMLGDFSFRSHSCSGADSSILFILVTTGIVGFLVFLGFLKEVYSQVKEYRYFLILIACFITLIVHSFFHNSIFYPWVLGWMMMVLGISLATIRRT